MDSRAETEPVHMPAVWRPVRGRLAVRTGRRGPDAALILLRDVMPDLADTIWFSSEGGTLVAGPTVSCARR